MEEVWSSIKNFEGYYEVSNLGQIRSIDRFVYHSNNGMIPRKGRVLKSALNHKGYLTVVLCKDGKNYTFIAHRVVAKEFLSNTNNLPQVNHKNGIKTDNRVDNLEWCSNKFNHDHAVRTGLLKNTFAYIERNKKAVMLSNKIDFTISFNTIKKAAKYLETSSGAIGNVLNGSRKSIKGYNAEYIH